MTQIPALPSYNEIADALVNVNPILSPAEVHGLFCGYITATGGAVDNRWEKFVLGKNKDETSRELLQQLYETSYHQMSEFSFEFSLLLPDDDSDINIRTEALGSWCQGFLSALQQCEIPIKNREESDVTETLNDIIEIAQVNYGDIVDDDEDETAYFELVEYVRLGALLIFHDMKSTTPNQPSNNDDNVLH
jgi:uncharacterized protein YgfB (UPF0149 family)